MELRGLVRRRLGRVNVLRGFRKGASLLNLSMDFCIRAAIRGLLYRGGKVRCAINICRLFFSFMMILIMTQPREEELGRREERGGGGSRREEKGAGGRILWARAALK